MTHSPDHRAPLPGAPLRLVCQRTGVTIVHHLEVARSFWQRFRGLQLRPPLPPGHGLWIAPCRSIHTHWMRFAIDLVMFDRQGSILLIRRHVRPWRLVAGPRQTHAVLEMLAGQLPDTLAAGDRLVWTPGSDG